MTIIYKLNHPIAPKDAVDIYRRAGLQRPQDIRIIKNILQHSNVIVTAWAVATLVGLLRAMTDFSFDCYLNDLAVDSVYQRQGIGRGMVEQLAKLLDDKVLIMLISSPDAIGFYESIGFTSGSEPYGQTMCMSV